MTFHKSANALLGKKRKFCQNEKKIIFLALVNLTDKNLRLGTQLCLENKFSL